MRPITRHSLLLLLAVLFLSSCGIGSSHGSVAAGQKFAANGQYRAAYIEAKKVLQRDKNNGQAWLLLGESSLRLGNPNDAFDELQNAKSHGVPESQWAIPMAQTLLILRKYETLLKTVMPQAAESIQDQATILSLRGDAHLGLDKPNDASQSYQKALKHDKKNILALLGLAKIAMAQHDSNSAKQYIQQAMEFSPNDARVWIAKGDFDYVEGDIQDAEADFEKAVKLKSHELLPQEWFYAIGRLANSQIELNQLKQASVNIQTLEKMSPRQPFPHYLHAVVDYKQGHLDDAVSQLQQVLKVVPDNEPAQMLLGAVNYAQGNLGQAEMYLSNVIGMDQNNAEARKLLAITLYRQGQSHQALDMLRPVSPKNLSDTALLALLQKEVAQSTAVGAGGSQGAKQSSSIEAQFARANQAEAQGNVAEAIRLLKEMPPGNVSYESTRHGMIVMAYLRDKKPQQAVKSAAEFAAKNPDNPTAHLIYGTAFVATGKHSQARAQYLQALSLDPKNVAALMSLGSLDGLERHYGQAKQRYESALKLAPKNTTVLTALGRLAVLQGDEAGAIRRFKQAIQVDPKMAAPYEELIFLYSRNRQFTEALKVAQSMSAIAPNNALVLNTLGAAQLNAGHYKDALAPLEEAVKKAPKEPLYRVNLARAQILTHDVKDAERNLSQVVSENASQLQATALLAFLKLQQDDLAGALSLARGLEKQSANRSAGLSLEGDLYMSKKNYHKAAQAYERALNIDYIRPLVIKTFQALNAEKSGKAVSVLNSWLIKNPDDNVVRTILGQYYLNVANYAQSVVQLERVLKAYPEDSALLNNLSWAYTKLNSPKALLYAKRAYKLAPHSAAVQDTYGWALVLNGDAKTALPLLQSAAKQAALNPQIQYHLAAAEFQNGNTKVAAALLRKLLASGQHFSDRADAQNLYDKITRAAAPGSGG